MTDPATTHFPHPIKVEQVQRPSEEKQAKIAYHMREILETLGLDLTDPSLQKTPERVAKMYVEEIFEGLDPANFPSLITYEETHTTDLIVVKNISFTSFCEHHLVPMHGKAHVAYLPKGHILGLSKLNRIVRYFSHRPQLQERLGSQIADSLKLILGIEDVAVILEATHFCVVARGVQDTSETETQVLEGKFATDLTWQQRLFLRLKTPSR